MRYSSIHISRVFSAAVLLVLFLVLAASCENQSSNIDDLREVCFETEVLPIFQNSCATLNCHDVAAKDGLRFDSYSGILKGVVPGDSYKSEIYRSIIDTGEDRMPPEDPLSLESRMLIRVWIEQGAMETSCKDSLIIPPDTTSTEEPWSNPLACFERDILPIMTSNCGIAGCHDLISMVEEYNFTNYNGILNGLDPGDPEGSKIYRAITEVEQSNLMPPLPYSRLAQAQVDSIYNWIKRGALDEDCGEACDTVDVTYTTHLKSLITNSCYSCHSGSFPSGGVLLESYNDLLLAVNSGAIPSVLYGNNGYSLMPPGGSLSECSISKFEIWITNGMAE